MTRRLIGREWGSPLIGQTLRKPRPQPLRRKLERRSMKLLRFVVARPAHHTERHGNRCGVLRLVPSLLCASLCLSSFKQCFLGCALMSFIIDAFDILIWGIQGRYFPTSCKIADVSCQTGRSTLRR